MDDPIDVWLRFAEDDPEEAEAEAYTFEDGDSFRVEWYLNSVGLVKRVWFRTYSEVIDWYEKEGFEDFTS